MKGILLAGGRGTRLFPVTKAVSKQLLPIYNKPLIYYPLATLMLAGIREIVVITNPHDKAGFENLLGDGSNFGVNLKFAVQDNPRGIAESIIIAEEFIGDDEFCLILGDNIFHGPGLGRDLMKHRDISGGIIFGFHVKNPNDYGIAVFDSNGDLVELIEKPSDFVSNVAVTGLYFYNSSVIELAKQLAPSDRGELEITDLNKKLLENGDLTIQMLPRGTSWLDTGTFDGMHDASSFVRIMEERTGVLIGDPAEVARHQGWI